MDDFIRFARQLYANCPQYVPDLSSDIRNMFDPKRNPGLEFTEIKAFVAYDNGKPVGRIAGIINHRANEKWQTRNVRFSFIDFIDDEKVSAALLNAVEKWGHERGMTHIQGPLGITDLDKEGMLVEDFDQLGSMVTIYNYPYYPRHLEALGFEKEVDWLQVRIRVPEQVPVKYARVAAYARDTLGLRVRKLTDDEITHGYGQRIFQLVNTAFEPLFGVSELTDKQINLYVSQYLKLIDKQLMPIVENEQGELVGMAVTMGSLSQAMQRAKGSLLPWGWFHLLRALKWQRAQTAEMLLIAVRPDYQGLGVNALFFDDLIPIYNKYGFRWAETGPQLEHNDKVLTQWKPLQPTFVKRRRCYHKTITQA